MVKAFYFFRENWSHAGFACVEISLCQSNVLHSACAAMTEIRALTVRGSESPHLQRPPPSQSVNIPVQSDATPSILITEESEASHSRMASPAPKRPRLEESHVIVLGQQAVAVSDPSQSLQQQQLVQGIPGFALLQQTLEVSLLSVNVVVHSSGVPSPQFFWGPNCLILSEQQYLCLGHRFSKQKMTRCAKNVGGHCPLGLSLTMPMV